MAEELTRIRPASATASSWSPCQTTRTRSRSASKVPWRASSDGTLSRYQINVTWDSGRTLALCVPPDEFRVLKIEEIP